MKLRGILRGDLLVRRVDYNSQKRNSAVTRDFICACLSLGLRCMHMYVTRAVCYAQLPAAVGGGAGCCAGCCACNGAVDVNCAWA